MEQSRSSEPTGSFEPVLPNGMSFTPEAFIEQSGEAVCSVDRRHIISCLSFMSLRRDVRLKTFIL
jgi:hypothetical protein